MRLDEFPGVNAGYVFELYERYQQNPESVDSATRQAFAEWTPTDPGTPGPVAAGAAAPVSLQAAVAAFGLAESIRRYRHLAAQVDPLGSTPLGDPTLAPAAHGTADADLQQVPASFVGGPVAENAANAYEAIERLRRIYCSTTGYDYAQVFVPEERQWLRH